VLRRTLNVADGAEAPRPSKFSISRTAKGRVDTVLGIQQIERHASIRTVTGEALVCCTLHPTPRREQMPKRVVVAAQIQIFDFTKAVVLQPFGDQIFSKASKLGNSLQSNKLHFCYLARSSFGQHRQIWLDVTPHLDEFGQTRLARLERVFRQLAPK
jgi:hypothetical protein